jgi:hypothetical protein
LHIKHQQENALTPEEQKYYETYFDLFIQDGWAQFIGEIRDIVANQRIEDIKDGEHLQYIKGERNALKRVLTFENGIRSAYDYHMERIHDS